MKNGALRNAMIITTKIIDVEGGVLVPVAGFFQQYYNRFTAHAELQPQRIKVKRNLAGVNNSGFTLSVV